ncbi:MAG: DUF202 domain-containing protein [Candidatus Woesearchaeota archaeon]
MNHKPKENKKEKWIRRDYLALERTYMANERTLLSYWRTSFSLIIFSLFLVKLDYNKNNLIISTICIFLSIILFIYGIKRFKEYNKRIKTY